MLVLAGIALALWRRMRDRGALALQYFAADFLPLIMLFAISVTGLALTASTLWLRGAFYGFLAILHAITVIGALLYLPFGKFFHIFQRPAQIGVKLYQAGRGRRRRALTARAAASASRRSMHIDDLEQVLPQLGFDYRIEGPAGHWQALCPACKRKTLASAQLRMQGGSAWLSRRCHLTQLAEQYGPHLNYTPPGGWEQARRQPPDKLVKTHCCFCGMQCGIQLKVRENQVVGFEPWEEFPFNKGMLCPEGREALSAGHSSGPPAHPLMRTDAGLQADHLRGSARLHRAAAARDPATSTARTRSRSTAAHR